MRPTIGALSTREMDVLWLASRGLSNAEIGRDLFLREATVKSHMARARKKLGAADRTHAVAVAYERGLFTAPSSNVVSAVRAALPLLAAFPRCGRHPMVAPLPKQCPDCARWVAARRMVAELNAVLPGGVS